MQQNRTLRSSSPSSRSWSSVNISTMFGWLAGGGVGRGGIGAGAAAGPTISVQLQGSRSWKQRLTGRRVRGRAGRRRRPRRGGRVVAFVLPRHRLEPVLSNPGGVVGWGLWESRTRALAFVQFGLRCCEEEEEEG